MSLLHNKRICLALNRAVHVHWIKGFHAYPLSTHTLSLCYLYSIPAFVVFLRDVSSFTQLNHWCNESVLAQMWRGSGIAVPSNKFSLLFKSILNGFSHSKWETKKMRSTVHFLLKILNFPIQSDRSCLLLWCFILSSL